MGYRSGGYRTVPFPQSSPCGRRGVTPHPGEPHPPHEPRRGRIHIGRAAIVPPIRQPDRPANPATDPTRAEALGRIAAEVSGRRDLTGLFHDIIDEAFKLFGVDRAGLWTYDASLERPLELAAQRGLPPIIVDAVTSLPKDARTAGMDALRTRRVRLLDRAMRRTTPALRSVYRAIGIGSICFVPLVYGDEVLGLLVLYHREAYPWTAAERGLARAFGDHMATAIGSAPTGRIATFARGAPVIDRRAGRPPERPGRPGGDRLDDRRRGQAPHRSRDDPRLPSRPRERPL